MQRNLSTFTQSLKVVSKEKGAKFFQRLTLLIVNTG